MPNSALIFLESVSNAKEARPEALCHRTGLFCRWLAHELSREPLTKVQFSSPSLGYAR